MTGFEFLIAFLAVAAAVGGLLVYLDKLKVEEQQRRERIQYAQRTRPIIEHTRYPGEPADDVRARADYHRQMLAQTRNEWLKPGDVREFYWRDIREASTYAAGFESWEEYLVELGRFVALVMGQWKEQISSDDLGKYRSHVLQPDPKLNGRPVQ